MSANPPEKAARIDAAAPEPPPAEKRAAKTDLLGNHKGKLAVGAAAMLGLAIYYKWRENKLARTDPEEYARLRRLKSAVDADEPARKHEGAHKQGQTE